jgi:ATP-dependent DNA helicase DinG
MYEHVVVIDLETTGVDPASDEILEFGCTVLRGGKIAETFSELVATRKPPPLPVQKLTGITPEMLLGRRPLEEALPDFLRFLERDDALYIAHQAAFDRAFLQAASGDAFRHRMLDTVGLSRILFPALQSHSLAYLSEALGLDGGPDGEDAPHRALADCHAAAALWQKLLQAAMELPAGLLPEINYLLAPLRNHPFRDFFRRLEKERFARDFGGGKAALRDLFANHKELIEKRRARREMDREFGSLDAEAVRALFEADGPLRDGMSAFEMRAGQVQMAAEVSEAFGSGRHLLVEAPTGIGKSLAYLVPAALFAAQEEAPVILSTNTKNLQSQLYEKDIPLVASALGLSFRSAIIKGRGNYLCLRKLFYVMDAADRELTNDERIQMCILLDWAVTTETGDIAECVLTGRPNFGPLWAKLRTIGDECMGRNCKSYNRCFLRRARALSLDADLVVANHALVFAEMNMESAVLPEYRHIVFDEAHNLEDAATDHLTVEVAFRRIMQVLGRLHRAGRGRRAGTGLAASIRVQMERAREAPQELLEMAARHLDGLSAAVKAAGKATPPFFEALAGGLGRARGERRRFAEGRKRKSVWERIERDKGVLVAALAQVMRCTENLVETFREMPSGSITYLRDFQRELEAVVQWLREIIRDVEFVLAGSEANYVYWLERMHPKQGGARACAAPLSIAELMHDQVYARKASCIFSSATLTVRDTFDFIEGRLGIDRIPPDRIRRLRAESPFDYDEQCLIMVPTFLKEPDNRGSEKYTEGLAALMEQLWRRTRGRGMGLFTSYAMLRGCYRALQEAMIGDEYTILAQGESGSREHITSLFIRDVHSILLGTHSFWEGVDVVGEALSCLLIARLPFAVFTDPIVEARCEQIEASGKDAFINYSVPNAVIRFKQGFGRLIRSRADRGVVVIADRRVVAKRYGRVFLDSLPTEAEVFNDRQLFLDEVEDFFSGENPAS